MSESVSVTGVWDYSEDFDTGKANGKIELQQLGNSLKGVARLKETDANGNITFVEEIIEGEIKDSKLIFYGISYHSDDIELHEVYNLDNWEGTYTSEEKIVGHTYDQDNICGVFVMSRIEGK